MRSNVSCWRLGGLSVTPRTGVRVDPQPDGFAFPHSLACFLIDADTQVHPKSSKKSGFQDNPLYFCMTGDMKMESDEERGDLKYLPWLVSKPSTISEERVPCIARFFFFFQHSVVPPGDKRATHTYCWGWKQVRDHRPVATQTDHPVSWHILSTAAASSEENHEACCPLFHLTQHRASNWNGKENIPGKRFQWESKQISFVSNWLT